MASTRLVTLLKNLRIDEWVDQVHRLTDHDGCAALWAKPTAYRRQRRIAHELVAAGFDVNILGRGSGRILTVAPPGEGVFWRGDGRPVWAG